jgi:hypothetical protein
MRQILLLLATDDALYLFGAVQYNQFGHATDMPPEPALEEHPFWQKSDGTQETKHDLEFRGMIKERKEWQEPQNQSFEDIFNEKR